MAGKITANVVQLGDSATASQNFHLKTNVDGTVSLNRGNDGAVIEEVLRINANGTLVQKQQSMIRVNGPVGFGSVNTGRRRFTFPALVSQGADITYTDSTTLGAYFTVNTNGVYAISYSDAFSGAADMGIALNTAAAGIPTNINEILAESTTANSGYRATASCTVYLPAGSVVSCYTGGSGISRAFFTITRVA